MNNVIDNAVADVNNYYRLDEMMYARLWMGVKAVENIHGHRSVWICNDTQPVRSFVCMHPDVVKFVDNDRTYFAVGVSLSTADYDLLQRIAIDKADTLGLIGINQSDVGLISTANPVLFWDRMCNRYAIIKAPAASETYTDAESAFVDLWTGFDWTFSFSDDPKVYRNWIAIEQENFRKGVDLGLTQERMKAIYKKMCKK